MPRAAARRPHPGSTDLPEWIRPQLSELVKEAPDGREGLHEIKFDGYRMHARLDHGAVPSASLLFLEATDEGSKP